MNQNALSLLVEQPNYDINLIVEEQGPNKDRRMYFEGIFMRANQKNKNNRVYSLEEMIRESGRYDKEMVKTGRALGELNHPSCQTSSAAILCEDGWKSIVDVKKGEQVYTLNTETDEIELNKVEEKIDELYNGVMYKLKGRNIDTIVTPTHRILSRTRNGKYQYITAEDIYNDTEERKYSHDYIPRRGEWNKDSPEYFTLKGVNVGNLTEYKQDITQEINIDYKTFMGFMGIWLSEGHVDTSRNSYCTYITQTDEEKSQRIRDLLSGFPKEMKWKERKSGDVNLFYLADRRLQEYLKPLGNKYEKYIPKEVKNSSSEMLEELLYWYCIGDGRLNQNTYDDYTVTNMFTVSKKLINDLSECLFKSGGSGNITEIICKEDYQYAGRTIKAENKVPLYQLNIATTKGIYIDSRFLTIEKIENFDDNVYCVRTKNSNFYCMDNGKAHWTGNSVEINPERACHMVTEIRQDRENFYGKSKILETPMGQIVRTLMLDGVKLGVSSRALGKLTENGDHNDVQDFRLICCDVVHDPSVDTAFVEGIFEAKQYILKCDGTVCEFVERTYDNLKNNLCSLSKQGDVRQQQLSNSVIQFINEMKNM